MRRIAALMLFVLMASIGFSQSHRVLITILAGNVQEMEGEILISDSTVTFKFPDIESIKKIESRNTKNVFSITDGTAHDKLMISGIGGKLKGIRYNTIIMMEPDKRFQDKTAVFYCWKED